MQFLAALESSKRELTEIPYYTLGGVKVEKPVAGVYVKRQGGKSVKVVVK